MSVLSKERKAMLSMFLCAIMWSISGFLTKLIPWHPMVISGTRCILSAAVLGIYMRMIGIKPVFNKNACLLALDVALIFVLYMPAVKLTTAANAIVMQYTAPIYVLLFSAIVYKQRVRRGDILTVVLTVAGIALFFFDQLGAGSTTGNIMALASGVFLGGMFFLGSKITEQERLSGLLFAQIFSVFIGLPFAFFSENPITTTSLIYIVLLGVVQLGLPYVLYTRAARHCPALQCSLISVIEPLLNPLWVFLIIGERLSVYALVGGFVVLATVTGWTIWDDRQKQNNR